MAEQKSDNKKMTRRAALATGAAGLASVLFGGCVTSRLAQTGISGYNSMSPIEQTGNQPNTMSYQESREVLDQYSGVPQVNGMLYFPDGEMRINTTGPLNSQAYPLARLQQAFAQALGESCSCNLTKTFLELGPADTCTSESQSYQLANNTGLLRVDSLSTCPAYTFTQIQQKIRLDNQSRVRSDIKGQITFGEPAFSAMMRTKDSVNWIMKPVEAGAIGYAVTGNPLGAGIGAGYQIAHNILDTIRGKKAPKRTYHADRETIITGLPFDSAQTKGALEKLTQLNGDTLALVPWTRQMGLDQCNNPQFTSGLGVVYGEGIKITGFGDADNDGCIDTVCFEKSRIIGDHLCDLIAMAGWGFLGFAVDEKIVKKYVYSGGGRDGAIGGDRHDLPTSGGGRSGASGGNRHGLPGGGGSSGGSIGGNTHNLPSGAGGNSGGGIGGNGSSSSSGGSGGSIGGGGGRL